MTRLLPRSLAARLAVATAATVAIAFAIAAVAVLRSAGHGDRDALDRELQASASRLQRPATIAVIAGQDGFGRGVRIGPSRELLDPGAERFAVVLNPDGTVLEAAGAVPTATFPSPRPDATPRTVHAGGERWRAVAVPLAGGAALEVVARLRPLEERAARLRRVVAIALLAALAGSALAALTLARLALAPLARLRAAAAGVGDTADLDARVPVGDGPVEVDELAGEFNGMLARLSRVASAREQALASARRFAADAGHELRTPLTSLRASLATLRRGDRRADEQALGSADHDLDRLATLVEQLQALARGEAGARSVEALDVGEAADAALASLRTRHPDVVTELHCADPGPVVHADPAGVRAILDNLLENAARHGRAAGPPRIAVTVAQRDGGAVLVVDDDGPGVPPDEREAVLGRFVRGAGARGQGSGLGLAIVAAQAQRHGGLVTLGDAPLGGLRVTVDLGTADARPAALPPV
jgi:signal transduction histidine kinase